jgi:hypothetical protein
MARNFTAASSQSLEVTSAPATNVPLTMCAWFQVPNADDPNAFAGLVTLGTQNGVDRYSLFYRSVVNNVAATAVQGGTLGVATTSSGPSSNTWTHACAVFTSTTSRTAYINAGNSGTNTTSVTVGAPNNVIIAARYATTLGAYLTGLIAEVGIWNAALTAAEIASLAKGMTCDKVRPQNLVFYAPLVRDLIDAKGGLTITNNNSATVANHPRVYA